MLSFQSCTLLPSLLLLLLLSCASAEPPPNGVHPSNILGGSEQHASFSFVRPGLTQTAFAFNGPSSHQAFSSSIGDSNLAQRVLPNVAQALAYRNPGLGYSQVGPVTTGYAAGPLPAQAVYQPQQIDYQQQQQALAYQQQLQQYQQYLQAYSGYAQQIQAQPVEAANQQSVQQAHLARLLATRFAGGPQAQPIETLPEQIQLQQQQQVQQQQQDQQQQQQTANLLGVAYSAAPSVAHVKVSGNGYKFDF